MRTTETRHPITGQDRGFEPEDAVARDGCAIAKSEVRPCVEYEIKAANHGVKEWTLASLTRNIWNGERGSFVAYGQFVTDIRIPPEKIAESVTAVLRQYRHNARALGGAAADEWAEAQIATEASRLVPDADGDHSPEWQRVHTEIRRGFHRYVLHLDDREPMPDGDYEVHIKGWSGWVPARLEREGRTWKLPIGRVSADGIESTVAAIRPAA